MANFVRRIVSGNKARFKDKQLDMELDLIYLTDHIIVMGFPATGVEGLYRNRREDTKKFLDHRHGKNYWVFNFCPLRENSYPASFFEGRVSRYPFPDHHAPPLAIFPLFVREAREWLSASKDNVAVLHCKAGKGRSGTLACAYLLSLDETPSPPKLQRSMTKKEWAKNRAERVMETVEIDEMDEVLVQEDTSVPSGRDASKPMSEYVGEITLPSTLEPEAENPEPRNKGNGGDGNAAATIIGKPKTETPTSLSPRGGSIADNIDHDGMQDVKDRSKARPFTLEDVLALHTARRMKSPSSPDKKVKHGVSIPSQRRWLNYWSLLLANEAPSAFWQSPLPRVRLREIHVQIRDLGGLKMNLLKIANHIIEKTGSAKYGVHEHGQGPIWVSLARYNDELVELLERWEHHTRAEDGNMGKRRLGTEYMAGTALREIFTDGKWDKSKMIRSFARLGASDSKRPEGGNVVSYKLQPLADQTWEALQEEMQESDRGPDLDPEMRQSLSAAESRAKEITMSAKSSVTDFAHIIDDTNTEKGVILDAAREVRAKLYMGQVFMGWFWFIPAFHMPPPPVDSKQRSLPPTVTNFVLSRKEIDFPIGAGAALVDIDVALEWVIPDLDPVAASRGPPKTQTSGDSAKGTGGEPGGPGGIAGSVVAGVRAVVSDSTGREVVEALEAGEQ
ncbi:uncharacterized protein FOMMEDRAFT_152681 [Fomitiporia mediterranea MF3/22]|uniref:uncharacterized protein n=1 Tax=Fomitiporia mediterranea (strain MF3/22) TaxID=694068 RepID=UPI000440976E|nr:uncharacterized protein FOMMEDRAFT_152681 [Fomitiporia mediterranea MF3/22]EJD05379.1 hypothetical protein FOMMEDRAFT_152681 [Fomitiporia mediterranea MF3/22]